MEAGKTTAEKGAAEVEKGETAAPMAAGEEAKKGPTAEEKAKGVAAEEEAVKAEVAYGDMITLKSSDGKPFEVSKEAAARLSEPLAAKIAAGGNIDGGGIELDNIGSEALEKVVSYCNKRDPVAAAPSRSRSFTFSTAPCKELEDSDRELVDRLSQGALFDLVDAADFLKMDGLLDVTCRKIADMMKGKNTAQIREIFNIENDYTKEEEEEVLQEHAWAFDD